MKIHYLLLIIVAPTILLLSSCKKQAPIVQYGPATATGTLIKAGQSLVRRGTHKLMINGSMAYYVESRKENLSDYEGQTVSVEGILEPNATSEDEAVLVVERIKGLDQNIDLRRFEVPELNLRIGIPASWKGSIKDHVAQFMMSDETNPLLTIRRMSGSTLPPGGTALYIKNRRTTRIDQSGGVVEIYILDKDTVILFRLDPSTQKMIVTKDNADIVMAQFERSLSTISFLSDKEVTVQTTGTGSGLTCGGHEGILCPEGYFCNVTNVELRSGQCKSR